MQYPIVSGCFKLYRWTYIPLVFNSSLNTAVSQENHHHNSQTIRIRTCTPLCLQQFTQTTFMWWSHVMEGYHYDSSSFRSRADLCSVQPQPHGCCSMVTICAYLHCTECSVFKPAWDSSTTSVDGSKIISDAGSWFGSVCQISGHAKHEM